MHFLSVKNLSKFQHYKKRSPPWIKLYRDFWTDYTLTQCGPIERLLFLGLCSLASELENTIPADTKYLSARLNFQVTQKMIECLSPMIARYADSTLTIPVLEVDSHNPDFIKPKSNGKDTKAQIPIPDDWLPKESHQKLATARGLELNIEAVHFKGKAQEKGWVTKDWDLKFKNWMLQEIKFRQARRAP